MQFHTRFIFASSNLIKLAVIALLLIRNAKSKMSTFSSLHHDSLMNWTSFPRGTGSLSIINSISINIQTNIYSVTKRYLLHDHLNFH